MNNISHWVEQEKWDKTFGQMRMGVRKTLWGMFGTQGLQLNIPAAEECIMDIIDAGFDNLRGVDKPIVARNYRPMVGDND